MQNPEQSLSAQERSFINLILRSVNPQAAAQMLGMNPDQGLMLINEERVLNHLELVRPHFDPTMFHNPMEVAFTKNDAHMMYLEAHKKAKDATEEIKAVDSLVKLHDLLAPQKVELNVTRTDQLKELDDKQLTEIAGMDIELDPQSYRILEHDETQEED